jgi:uncharacterized protein
MKNILNIENLINQQNPWFENRGFTVSEKTLPKRKFYHDFKKLVNDTKQISALIGIRRVGKTVMLRQLLSEILESNNNLPLYFSFDQEMLKNDSNPISEVLEFYLTQILNKKLHQINKTSYIFFDEIQLVPYWQDIIKRYYDQNQHLKFIISGSSSLFLRDKSKESLAGRIFEQVLTPLTYVEYQKIAQGKFRDYLKYGGFFELIELNDDSRKKEFMKEWVLGKVLERDLPNSLRLSDRQIFRVLYSVLLGTTGHNVVLSKIATELEVSATAISNYVEILEKTLLLSSLYNFAGSFVRRERRLRKIYPASSNFLNILPIFPDNYGVLAETYVFNYLKNIKKYDLFYFNERGKEVDFLIPDKKIAIEVKYQEKIHPEDYKNLRLVMEKKKYSFGYVFTKNLSEKKLFPEGKIYFVPVDQIETISI